MIKENLVDVFGKAIRENWDSMCFSDYGGMSFSYSKVAGNILRLHGIFKTFGVRKGDKIALCGRNSSNWAVVYLSAVTYGAVIVPILVDFSEEEIIHIVNHSDSKMFFVSGSVYDRINQKNLIKAQAVNSLETFEFLFADDESKKAECYAVDDEFCKKMQQDQLVRDSFGFDPIADDTIAAIVYTSGTTGFSKGVMITHKALMVNIKFFVEHLLREEKGAVLSFLPLAHCFGCAFDFLSQFVRGAHIYFLGRIPTPKVILQAFEEINPILVVTVPLILEKIYQTKIVPLLENPVFDTLLKIPVVRKII